MPLTVGGGVRTTDDIRNLLLAGADKASINSAAVADRDIVRQAAEKFGAQCVVVAIDAKRVSATGEAPRWEIFTHGGRRRDRHRGDRLCTRSRRSRRGRNPFDLDGSRRIEAGLRSRADPSRRRRGRHSGHRLGRRRRSRPSRRGRASMAAPAPCLRRRSSISANSQFGRRRPAWRRRESRCAWTDRARCTLCARRAKVWAVSWRA